MVFRKNPPRNRPSRARLGFCQSFAPKTLCPRPGQGLGFGGGHPWNNQSKTSHPSTYSSGTSPLGSPARRLQHLSKVDLATKKMPEVRSSTSKRKSLRQVSSQPSGFCHYYVGLSLSEHGFRIPHALADYLVSRQCSSPLVGRPSQEDEVNTESCEVSDQWLLTRGERGSTRATWWSTNRPDGTSPLPFPPSTTAKVITTTLTITTTITTTTLFRVPATKSTQWQFPDCRSSNLDRQESQLR